MSTRKNICLKIGYKKLSKARDPVFTEPEEFYIDCTVLSPGLFPAEHTILDPSPFYKREVGCILISYFINHKNLTKLEWYNFNRS